MRFLDDERLYSSTEECLSFLRTLDPPGTAKTASERVHLYWHGRFGRKPALAVKSFVATQDLDRVGLRLWVDGERLDAVTGDPRLAPFLPHIRVTRFDPEQAAVGTPLEHRPDLYSDPSPTRRSNFFRFAVLHRFGGLYVDTDTVFLRDLRVVLDDGRFGPEFCYRWSAGRPHANSAVLRLRPGSATASALLAECDARDSCRPRDILVIDRHQNLDLVVLPAAFFDPLWPHRDGADRYAAAPFDRFSDFFRRFGRGFERRPWIHSFRDFFPGALTYHWHGNWKAREHADSYFGLLEREFDSIVRHRLGAKPKRSRLPRALRARLFPDVETPAYNVSSAADAAGRKRALLVHRLQAFTLDERDPRYLSHHNIRRCRHLAGVLGDLGYAVDVGSAKHERFRSEASYDLVVSVKPDFDTRQISLEPGATRIFFGLTLSPGVHNANMRRRQELLRRRRGCDVAARRIYTEDVRFVDEADAVLCLGNEVTANTWRAVYPGPIRALDNLGYAETTLPADKDFEDARKHFLYFASRPQLQKGLDLLLEVFPQHPDLHLHVCGLYEREKDFCACYHRELFETPNVHPVGWVRPLGAAYDTLVKTCAHVVPPGVLRRATGVGRAVHALRARTRGDASVRHRHGRLRHHAPRRSRRGARASARRRREPAAGMASAAERCDATRRRGEVQRERGARSAARRPRPDPRGPSLSTWVRMARQRARKAASLYRSSATSRLRRLISSTHPAGRCATSAMVRSIVGSESSSR